MGLGRRAPEARPSSERLSPGGGFVGWRVRGAGDEVKTIPFAQFRELLGEIGNGARPITTPATYEGLWYRRYDGSTIGIRFSREHGVTLETIGRNQSLPPYLKVHSR